MREERRKEVSQKKNQTFLSFKHKDVLQEVEEMCEDEGESLDDLINDGFMIKCEGKLVVRDPRIKSVAKDRTFLTKMEAFKPLKKRLLLLSVRKWSLS